MSKPVVASSWAGSFNCDFCSKKRLSADNFSNKALENHRKSNKPLKCKECIEAAQKAEQSQAAAKTASKSSDETAMCSACQRDLSVGAFNKTQLRKGEDQRRCRECILKAEEDERETVVAAKASRKKYLEEQLEKAEKSGNASEKCKFAAALSAFEAELVTGLKPVLLGKKNSQK